MLVQIILVYQQIFVNLFNTHNYKLRKKKIFSEGNIEIQY